MHEPATFEDMLRRYGRGQEECEVLRLVFEWAGSPQAAQDWLHTSIPSLAAAPSELMRDGYTERVLVYLHRIGVGGFA